MTGATERRGRLRPLTRNAAQLDNSEKPDPDQVEIRGRWLHPFDDEADKRRWESVSAIVRKEPCCTA